MEARALGQLLDEDNRSICLHSNSRQLFYLSFWATYLLMLRFLALVVHAITIPGSLQGHIIRVESRIVNIAISIVQIVPGAAVAEKYRRRCSRDESFEGSLSHKGPAGDLMAPRASSLDSSGVPEMFLHQPDIVHLGGPYLGGPQAPRPPYHRQLENVRTPYPWEMPPPLQPAVTNPRRNFFMPPSSIDGTVSPPAFFEPIPRIPIPPVPTFLARMPLASVSDSIYSSCSTQLRAAQLDGPVNSSSLEIKPSAEAQTYTNLLPKRSFDDYEDGADTDNPNKANPSTKSVPGNNTSSGNATSFSTNFPIRIRQDLEHNTLAAMAQHYARMSHRRSRSTRSASAPISRAAAESKL